MGPFVKLGSTYASLGKDDDVLTVGLNRAVDLIIAKREKQGGAATKGYRNRQTPQDGKPITRQSGRYGPYIKHGGTNATIPKDQDPEAFTLEQAVELLKAQAAKKKEEKETTLHWMHLPKRPSKIATLRSGERVWAVRKRPSGCRWAPASQ